MHTHLGVYYVKNENCPKYYKIRPKFTSFSKKQLTNINGNCKILLQIIYKHLLDLQEVTNDKI